jgi:biotin synthase
MGIDEILESVDYAVNKLGFKALVLQSGEDYWYDGDKLQEIVREIRKRMPALIFLSIGERDAEIYKRLYDEGARGALIRFETGNHELYSRIKPGQLSEPVGVPPKQDKLRDLRPKGVPLGTGSYPVAGFPNGGNPSLWGPDLSSGLEKRLELIRQLKDIGYLIITGFLVGLPGETSRDIIKNIKLTGELAGDATSNDPECFRGAEVAPSGATKEGMFSFGPFIPHPQTPLGNTPKPKLSLMLNTIAKARLMYPESRILVTTALETLDKENGAREALMAGANSLMINITPVKYRKLYEIYPDRAGIDDEITNRIAQVLELLKSLGRAPTDIGL